VLFLNAHSLKRTVEFLCELGGLLQFQRALIDEVDFIETTGILTSTRLAVDMCHAALTG